MKTQIEGKKNIKARQRLRVNLYRGTQHVNAKKGDDEKNWVKKSDNYFIE